MDNGTTTQLKLLWAQVSSTTCIAHFYLSFLGRTTSAFFIALISLLIDYYSVLYYSERNTSLLYLRDNIWNSCTRAFNFLDSIFLKGVQRYVYIVCYVSAVSLEMKSHRFKCSNKQTHISTSLTTPSPPSLKRHSRGEQREQMVHAGLSKAVSWSVWAGGGTPQEWLFVGSNKSTACLNPKVGKLTVN